MLQANRRRIINFWPQQTTTSFHSPASPFHDKLRVRHRRWWFTRILRCYPPDLPEIPFQSLLLGLLPDIMFPSRRPRSNGHEPSNDTSNANNNGARQDEDKRTTTAHSAHKYRRHPRSWCWLADRRMAETDERTHWTLDTVSSHSPSICLQSKPNACPLLLLRDLVSEVIWLRIYYCRANNESVTGEQSGRDQPYLCSIWGHATCLQAIKWKRSRTSTAPPPTKRKTPKSKKKKRNNNNSSCGGVNALLLNKTQTVTYILMDKLGVRLEKYSTYSPRVCTYVEYYLVKL